MVKEGNNGLGRVHSVANRSNSFAKKFSTGSYSKVMDITGLLLKKEISVEKKKNLLMKLLSHTILEAFSIKKEKFNRKNFNAFAKKLQNARKIIDKLRSINYYLETALLQNSKYSASKQKKEQKLDNESKFVKSELQALEYTSYKLIEEAVILDKRLLKEYSRKEKFIGTAEKTEIKDIRKVLAKETYALEHLEAKIPPARAASMKWLKEPFFTHWAARAFSLLAYIETMYENETAIFGKYKKNSKLKTRLNRKISHLIKEKSRLLKILQEKAVSMNRLDDSRLREELHNFTTAINL